MAKAVSSKQVALISQDRGILGHFCPFENVCIFICV